MSVEAVELFEALERFRWLKAVAIFKVATENGDLTPKERVRIIDGLLRDLDDPPERLRDVAFVVPEVPTPRREVARPVRERVFERDGHRCLSCGSDERLVVDHVVPLAKGGAHDESNFQTLCGPCNSVKGTLAVDYRVDVPAMAEES